VRPLPLRLCRRVSRRVFSSTKSRRFPVCGPPRTARSTVLVALQDFPPGLSYATSVNPTRAVTSFPPRPQRFRVKVRVPRSGTPATRERSEPVPTWLPPCPRPAPVAAPCRAVATSQPAGHNPVRPWYCQENLVPCAADRRTPPLAGSPMPAPLPASSAAVRRTIRVISVLSTLFERCLISECGHSGTVREHSPQRPRNHTCHKGSVTCFGVIAKSSIH